MDALWADAQKQADAYYDQYGYYTDATAFLSQEYYDLQNSIYDTNNEIWAAEKSIKNYNKAMEEDADAVSDAEAEIALAEEAVKNLTASMSESTGASEEAAAQAGEFQAAISGVQEKINALVESYNEAYSAAYESISGQYQLWDEAAKVVATSAGSINSALESQPQVEKVHHPSVSDDPEQQALYAKYFPNGGGSIFTFEIKGDAQKAKDFIDNLELFSLLANVADVKSLVIHPATTTHSQCTEEELLDQGIKPNTIRLSIGTENIDDIIEDLDEAFEAVQ